MGKINIEEVMWFFWGVVLILTSISVWIVKGLNDSNRVLLQALVIACWLIIPGVVLSCRDTGIKVIKV